MPDYGLNSEFEQLFNAALDETLTADQQAALEAALADDPQLLDTYLAFCRFHADLRHHAQSARSIETALREVAPGVCPPAPDQRPLAAGRSERFERIGRWTNLLVRQIHPRQHPVYFTAISLVLCIGFWGLLVALLKPSWHTHPVAQDRATEPDTVARVVWVDNPWWEGFEPRGHGLPAGQQLVLNSGLAEIRYHTGAIVILEGPAEFTVGISEPDAADTASNPQSAIRNPQSKNSGVLARGKLVAHCGRRESKGFTVDTPHARVRDLGTEFAVDVQDDGRAQVEVISGTVELVGQPAGGGEGQRLRLKKGQGASVDSDGGAITRRGKGTVQLAAAMRSRLQQIRLPMSADYRRANVPLETPSNVAAALVLDLSAARGTDTQVDGGVISTWSDGRSVFTRYRSDARFVADSGSGIPAIEFDRSAPFLGDITKPNRRATIGDATIFVWAKFDGYTHGAGKSSYYYSIAGTGNEHTLGRDGDGGTDYIYHWDGAGETTGTLQAQPAGWNLYIAKFYGASLRGTTSAEAWIDSVGDGAVVLRSADLTNSDSTPYLANADSVRIGAWTNAGSGLDGQIRALRIYNGILSDAEIQAVAKEITR